MVLRASSVESYRDTGSAYSVFANQAIFAALAVADRVWLAVAAVPADVRRLAYPALLVSLVLLVAVLVPGVGLESTAAQLDRRSARSSCSPPSSPSSR